MTGLFSVATISYLVLSHNISYYHVVIVSSVNVFKNRLYKYLVKRATLKGRLQLEYNEWTFDKQGMCLGWYGDLMVMHNNTYIRN